VCCGCCRIRRINRNHVAKWTKAYRFGLSCILLSFVAVLTFAVLAWHHQRDVVDHRPYAKKKRRYAYACERMTHMQLITHSFEMSHRPIHRIDYTTGALNAGCNGARKQHSLERRLFMHVRKTYIHVIWESIQSTHCLRRWFQLDRSLARFVFLNVDRLGRPTKEMYKDQFFSRLQCMAYAGFNRDGCQKGCQNVITYWL